jgi:hypothetical protein
VAVILFLSSLVQATDNERPIFTRFDVSREKEDHKVSVSAVLKNQGPADLADVWVSVTYYDGDRELKASKPTRVVRLPSRESIPLTLDARQVEKFSRYEVLVETEERKLVYAGTISDAAPKLKRVDPVPVRTPESRPTAEIRGLKWFERDPLEQKQDGPSDVPFIRIAVRQKRQDIHPSGKVQIMIFDGTKPVRYLNIGLTDACYLKDAGDLNTRTALPETVAYDPLSGELWIGLIRVDHAKTRLRVDINLILDETGTWEWKGLEKTFVTEPRASERR